MTKIHFISIVNRYKQERIQLVKLIHTTTNIGLIKSKEFVDTIDLTVQSPGLTVYELLTFQYEVKKKIQQHKTNFKEYPFLLKLKNNNDVRRKTQNR